MSTAIKPTLRYCFALIGLGAFVWAIWIVSRDGLSSLAAKNALDREQLASANRAVALNSRNPDAYYARASVYQKNGQITEAIKDLQNAVDLKPGDYFLRVELGYTRYQTGDITGATADFEAAVRLAPFYAQPRWYLGNMLLQAGHLDEGFAELRRAVKSDPAYLPETIQRATEVFAGDPTAIAKAVGTDSSETRLALERYFIQHDNIAAAMELFRAGKDMPVDDVRSLLTDLLNAKRFDDAYEVWLVSRGIDHPAKKTITIWDGGFESNIAPDALGFEWQLEPRGEKVRVSIDSSEFHTGGHSLRIDYDGKSEPATRVVSQLVLVEPSADYKLSFVAQTRELITGGLPVVTVTDAADGQLLVQSRFLPQGTSSWGNYEVDCKTGPGTRAVIVGIQRVSCSSSPCPAFGRAWFDDFVWQSR